MGLTMLETECGKTELSPKALSMSSALRTANAPLPVRLLAPSLFGESAISGNSEKFSGGFHGEFGGN